MSKEAVPYLKGQLLSFSIKSFLPTEKEPSIPNQIKGSEES